MLSDADIDASVKDLAHRMLRCFTAPPRMTVDAWADKYRELSKIANARGGRWRSRCYQREPMVEMTNRDVRSIVVIGAAQTFGKSELVLNFIGRNIHLNPGPMMMVLPTNEMAERFSKKRVAPMLRDTAVLRALCGDQKSRSSNNTIRAKEFPGGSLSIAGANTPNELCSDPQRDVSIDEVDRCEEAAGREGDIVTLAEARQESFGRDAFSLFTSTPSGTKPRPIGETQPEGVSKIMLLFADSDQQYWFCPCQKCGRHQTLKWSQVTWPEHKPEDARYICEFDDCKYTHTDLERVAMIERGEWRATAPFAGRRGYFLNGIYSLSSAQRGCVSKLHQMARDFLRSKRRGKEALRAWVNTFLCECFADENTETVEPMPLYARRETLGDILPENCCFITAGADVHPYRLEAQIIGWGEGEESWPLEYGVFLGDTKTAGPWKQLDEFLQKRFEHPCGAMLEVTRTCVDTGHSTDEAYEFCRSRALRGIFAIKGMKGIGQPVMNPPRKSGVRRVRLWMVAKNTALKTIVARMKMQEPGAGYIHFRKDREPMFGTEYFAQLTANEVVTVHRAGVEIQDFDAGSRRDEAMDTFVYSLAALRARDTNFAKIMQRMKAARAEEILKQSEEKVEARKPVAPVGRSPFSGGGWKL